MAKKKNRVTTTRTTESGYFHTGNSGITLSVNEIENSYVPAISSPTPLEPELSYNYRLEARHGAFGSYSQISIPLGSLHLVTYLIQSLTRTRDRMVRNHFSHEYAFEYSAKPHADCYAEIVDGLTRNEVRKEFVSGPNSTVTKIVGYDFYDGDKLIKTEYLDQPFIDSGSDSCSGGGKALPPKYSPSQIGWEVVDSEAIDPIISTSKNH